MLLDEPTNHLDMESIESLTPRSTVHRDLVFVSHDREFGLLAATRIIELGPGERRQRGDRWWTSAAATRTTRSARTAVGGRVVQAAAGQTSSGRQTRALCEAAGRRQTAIAEKRLKVWFDKEGDYLEVIFDQRRGISARPRTRTSWGKGREGQRPRILP